LCGKPALALLFVLRKAHKVLRKVAQEMKISPGKADGDSSFFKLNIKSRVWLVMYAIKNE
jgi:hypothetical protein